MSVLGQAEKLRNRLVNLPRRHKRVLQVITDVVLVWTSLWLAFVVRLGDTKAIEPLTGHLWLFLAAPVIAIPLFIRFGMYRAVMRYFGNDALLAIAKAVSISALLLALAVYWNQDAPKAIPIRRVRHFVLAEREYGTGVSRRLGLNSEAFDAHVAGEPVEV